MDIRELVSVCLVADAENLTTIVIYDPLRPNKVIQDYLDTTIKASGQVEEQLTKPLLEYYMPMIDFIYYRVTSGNRINSIIRRGAEPTYHFYTYSLKNCLPVDRQGVHVFEELDILDQCNTDIEMVENSLLTLVEVSNNEGKDSTILRKKNPRYHMERGTFIVMSSIIRGMADIMENDKEAGIDIVYDEIKQYVDYDSREKALEAALFHIPDKVPIH